MIFYATEVSGFIALFLYASFFEWVLHRFLMHQLVWSYPFKSHALVHHGIFRSGPTYFLSQGEDLKLGKIRFAWWNAPLILGLHIPLLLWIQRLLHMNIFFGGMAALGLYYFFYEYLHFCMHVPKERWIEKTAWFSWLDSHHHMHHKRHFNNLNVVLPLADLVFGTLIPARDRLAVPERPGKALTLARALPQARP
ncbi:MAG: sterol desaturase family protein [Deltaproteobacteria bacterium]|nr:sterol desaturase family protein [Deltaproteobacteria bacterium]MBI2349574.1 sterol desaturase family protein [Deltaproteobacteria bacterium]MBI2538954.1 sterol desaturase family protein [Deltaproteobacteria bacterium]MBI2991139.1 sterol desaturase family protein [Deltaproteobacteria bacterium]